MSQCFHTHPNLAYVESSPAQLPTPSADRPTTIASSGTIRVRQHGQGPLRHTALALRRLSAPLSCRRGGCQRLATALRHWRPSLDKKLRAMHAGSDLWSYNDSSHDASYDVVLSAILSEAGPRSRPKDLHSDCQTAACRSTIGQSVERGRTTVSESKGAKSGSALDAAGSRGEDKCAAAPGNLHLGRLASGRIRNPDPDSVGDFRRSWPDICRNPRWPETMPKASAGVELGGAPPCGAPDAGVGQTARGTEHWPAMGDYSS